MGACSAGFDEVLAAGPGSTGASSTDFDKILATGGGLTGVSSTPLADGCSGRSQSSGSITPSAAGGLLDGLTETKGTASVRATTLGAFATINADCAEREAAGTAAAGGSDFITAVTSCAMSEALKLPSAPSVSSFLSALESTPGGSTLRSCDGPDLALILAATLGLERLFNSATSDLLSAGGIDARRFGSLPKDSIWRRFSFDGVDAPFDGIESARFVSVGVCAGGPIEMTGRGAKALASAGESLVSDSSHPESISGAVGESDVGRLAAALSAVVASEIEENSPDFERFPPPEALPVVDRPVLIGSRSRRATLATVFRVGSQTLRLTTGQPAPRH